ncbi:MAG: YceI family protein [Weeksellaceae bacterium]|nr:YceI family protein [Weeksellaceae bacterium]
MTQWNLDASHSEVQFKVKHMVISTVTGSFDQFSANAESLANDFSDSKFAFTADVASINTKNADRDTHLKSEDFFSVDQYPQIKFESTSGIVDGKIAGEIEIKGTKQPIVLSADFGGEIVDPWGMTRVGFEFEGEINRKDFGLSWTATTEAGGLVVSDKVKLIVNLEFVKA